MCSRCSTIRICILTVDVCLLVCETAFQPHRLEKITAARHEMASGVRSTSFGLEKQGHEPCAAHDRRALPTQVLLRLCLSGALRMDHNKNIVCHSYSATDFADASPTAFYAGNYSIQHSALPQANGEPPLPQHGPAAFLIHYIYIYIYTHTILYTFYYVQVDKTFRALQGGMRKTITPFPATIV